jgi:hypothetical protein
MALPAPEVVDHPTHPPPLPPAPLAADTEPTLRTWPPEPARELHGYIKEALLWIPPEQSPSILQFELNTTAAEHNFEVLAAHNFDLHRVITADSNCPLHPGSEFRPPAVLNGIASGHPLWPRTRYALTHGAHIPCRPLPEETRQLELPIFLDHGNHKSARLEGGALIVDPRRCLMASLRATPFGPERDTLLPMGHISRVAPSPRKLDNLNSQYSSTTATTSLPGSRAVL